VLASDLGSILAPGLSGARDQPTSDDEEIVTVAERAARRPKKPAAVGDIVRGLRFAPRAKGAKVPANIGREEAADDRRDRALSHPMRDRIADAL
jgi:hypothetical protein